MLRFILLLLTLSALPAFAQEPYTLHVFQDLVQVPTLVLNPSYESVLGLNEANFSLSMDSGPLFHPTHLHPEADEPLNLVLVLDDRKNLPGTQKALLNAFQQGLSKLPADLFRPGDRLSLFAFDCVLIRTAQDLPAGSALLKHAVTEARANPSLHVGLAQPCTKPLHLWDALYGIASLSASIPGRSVLLVLTSGQDSEGIQTWESVRIHAGGLGFAVFAIRDLQLATGKNEDHLGLLCGGTGGLVASVEPSLVTQDFQRVFHLIRDRYILEFPRPSNGTSGLHRLDVKVSDPTLFVSASGFSAPLLDHTQSPAAATASPVATQRPTLGTRKPLTPH